MMQSGNLRRAKNRLMNDPSLAEMLVRCGWDEIMVDLNQDAAADVCFSDENKDGDIDTISIDLTGNGEFNLYFHDADGNGMPDTVYYAEDGADQLELLAEGKAVEERFQEIVARLMDLLTAEEFLNEQMVVSLDELSVYLKENLTDLITEVQKLNEPTGIEKVCSFLENAGTYYLATDEDGQPHVRPFGTILLYEGKLYIQTGKVKDVSRQLSANPKAEICAFMDGVWVRLTGELVNDDRLEVKEAMLDKHPSLKAMYSAEDENTQVLYFENAKAVFYSFTAEPEVVSL